MKSEERFAVLALRDGGEKSLELSFGKALCFHGGRLEISRSSLVTHWVVGTLVLIEITKDVNFAFKNLPKHRRIDPQLGISLLSFLSLLFSRLNSLPIDLTKKPINSVSCVKPAYFIVLFELTCCRSFSE